MREEKYIRMDVHQATISAAVMDVHGKLLMECLLVLENPQSYAALAGVPEEPPRGHCRHGFLYRPHGHFSRSILLFL